MPNSKTSMPNSKRPRLESVIVRPASQVKAALGAKPVRPQGWSSGKLPEREKKSPLWGAASGSGAREAGLASEVVEAVGSHGAVSAAGPAAEAVEAFKAFL
jgi:hypothetical protein